NFQRQLYLQRAGASDEFFEGFSLHELHRVEAVLAGSAQVKDRGNIRVTNARCCTGFAQKTKPRRFIAQVPFANNLQGHRVSQIDVERLVSDPHRSSTQLDRFPVFARHQFVVLKSSRWLNRVLRNRRLAGNNSASETLAEHADWAEFDCPRNLVTA